MNGIAAKDLPSWALVTVTLDDWDLARDALRRGSVQVTWPDRKALRRWASERGWPASRVKFEDAFLERMFRDEPSFRVALAETGIGLRAPCREYRLPSDELAALDALYSQRSASGYPERWGTLVEALRGIRRAVEAGVLVKIEGQAGGLGSWQQFYEWAHGRYHALEDGYDSWIGDDQS